MITTLIDTPDRAELVRDAIVLLLEAEATEQVALATTALKPDPTLWALDVYRENSDPVDLIGDSVAHVPIVNVRLGDMQIDPSATNNDNYPYDATYLIDVLGAAKSSDTTNADTGAMLVVNRGVRLVRNILAAAEYNTLGFPLKGGQVGKRTIESINYYTPDNSSVAACKTAGCQIRLTVKITETSPQIAGQILNLIIVTTNRIGDAFNYFVANFQK